MERVKEMSSGKVAVVGKKSVLKNVFYQIINDCRTGNGKTFVLCGDASPFFSNEDEFVRMGVRSQNSETLPDFLEPFLMSPSIGTTMEDIVSAMGDMFFSEQSTRDSNEQYFLGTAEMLFQELITYSLMAAKKDGKVSFPSVAEYFTSFSKEFSAMIAHTTKGPGSVISYVYSDKYLAALAATEKKPLPFADTLIDNHSTTANNVEGTMRTHTPRMNDLMARVAKSKNKNMNKFSFLKNAEQKDDGVVFLQPGASFRTYQKVLFIFVCECLKLLAEIYPQKEFKLVIPDICYWKIPAALLSLLESAPDNLSVIWGASSLSMAEQLAKSRDAFSASLVSISETQVWGRNSDATAHYIYTQLVPDTLREYDLSQMPEALCYVKSDDAEFAPVTIPDMPDTQNFSKEFPILSSYGKIITPSSDTSVCIQEENLEEVAAIINCIESRNLFLRGKAGVGKTATMYALAKYLASGKCGPKLSNMVIAQLNLAKINSSSAGIEKSVSSIWAEASRTKNVILFIDEGHRIASNGIDSIGNILKPFVTSGEVPVILATTDDEFRRHIDPDPALKRRFPPLQISEPKGRGLLAILKSKSEYFAKEFNVNISEKIYKKAIALASRYIHETANPEKSIRLLERACSLASLRKDERDVSVSDLKAGLKLAASVVMPKSKKISAPADITAVLCRKIKGQDVAAEKAGEFISHHSMGFFNSDIPASLALLGPRGCGKTTLAKEIAEKLGYSGDEVMEIRMSGLKGYNSMLALLGSAGEHGYAGSLTEPVRKNPNRFIIIDGVEQMPDDAVSIFEQMLSTGIVRDGAGNSVSFKNAVVVFTGEVEEGKDFGFSIDADVSEKVRKYEEEMSRELGKKFSGSFCSKISALVPFAALSKPVMTDIIRLACEESFKNLGIRFELTDEACEHIAKLCDYEKSGAREVDNKLGGILRNFASSLYKKTKTARIVLEKGELRAVPKKAAEIVLSV